VVALIVFDQMVRAILFDHFAQLGAPETPITRTCLAGATLLIGEVVPDPLVVRTAMWMVQVYTSKPRTPSLPEFFPSWRSTSVRCAAAIVPELKAGRIRRGDRANGEVLGSARGPSATITAPEAGLAAWQVAPESHSSFDRRALAAYAITSSANASTVAELLGISTGARANVVGTGLGRARPCRCRSRSVGRLRSSLGSRPGQASRTACCICRSN
jgi:hypothetical protein